MDFFLRQADSNDLDDVMVLEEAGFPPGIAEARSTFARRIGLFPEGFLIAKTGTQVVGYLCAEIWNGWDLDDPRRFNLGHELHDWLDRSGDTLYLSSMTILPSARGKGLGRSVFRQGLEQFSRNFPALGRIVLVVNEHWAPAMQIYQREGFAEVGRLPEFFRPHDGPDGAAIVMERKLRPA